MKRQVQYKGVIYEVDEEDLKKVPAINISQSEEDDGTRIVIANCVISQDGFKPLTEAVKTLTKIIAYGGSAVWVVFSVVLVSLAWR